MSPGATAALSPRSSAAVGAIDTESAADLVRALEHYKALGGVSAFCLRGVAALAAGAPACGARKALLSAGAPAAAVRTLCAYPERADVAHYGCKALANMAAWSGGWEAVLAAGGAGAAVAAIRAYGGGAGGGGGDGGAAAGAAAAPVLQYACKVLAALAAGPAEGGGGGAATRGRDAVVLAGGPRALFSVASLPGVSDEALYYALKGAVPLAAPGAAEELRARMVALGWPARVCGLLAPGGRADSQLALASASLRFLAAQTRCHSGGRAAVLAGGGAALVVRVLAALGGEHASVAAAGVAVLRELADGTAPEVARFSSAGSVGAIVKAMAAHEGAVEVAREGCAALKHCAVFLPEETVVAGGVAAVERAEALHAAECGVVAREARKALALKTTPGTTPLISSFSPRPPPF